MSVRETTPTKPGTSEHRGFFKEASFQVSPRRKLVRGDTCWIKGERGPWKFMSLVHPRDARRSKWVDVYKDGHGVRSFDARRVKTRP